ncbi:dienelactone hydrolase [Microdochium bolleyi]|uniref:Dienelactone hydrolase n=1 Tax=Microdochium bolleyi TaxID=196109 RepID=A0A136IV79_9PEZI|nr:dienelactone hydrolase [Microdochium bolleyi]
MEDRVLAKPADLCCLKGAIHTGEPAGKVEQIGGVDTYVARPDPTRANGNVLLFFPDAFGLHINSFLMMDAFADCGYLTLGVDYFLGDGISKYSANPLNDPNFDFVGWKDKHYNASEEVAAKWVADVKALHGKPEGVKFACVGYCWGARFVCQQLSEQGYCKVGAIAHPSFVNESHVDKVNEPLFLSVPSQDKLFEVAERNRTVEMLSGAGKHFNMQIFSDVGHGFASRTRLTDPYERWAKEQSFKSFVDWFDFWLAKA